MGFAELRAALEDSASELIAHAYGMSHAERSFHLQRVGLLAGRVLSAADGLPDAGAVAASVDALLHRVQSHVGAIKQCERILRTAPGWLTPSRRLP